MRQEKKNSEKGMALVITLMITALLVVVITEIAYAVHVHQSMSAIFIDAQDAGLLAEGGVDLAGAAIEEMTEDTYTFIDEEETRVLPVGEKFLTLRVVDEQARVSVNAIIYKNGQTNEKLYDIYARLINILDLDPALADIAADWMDPDDEPRSLGAEDPDYYTRSSVGYKSKGGPLDSAGELALAKGYSPEVMGKLVPNITAYGDGLININNAPRVVLMALSVDITEALADAVIAYRKKTPFKTTADIRKVEGFEIIGFDLQGLITVKSKTFRIFSRAVANEAVREVEAVVSIGGINKRLFWRER
ncbi:MAG: type II secretion system minor pseudopilin GspK [Thermodesulfobacteriota bacterium]